MGSRADRDGYVQVIICRDDGSVEDAEGRVLHFSIRRFVRDICEGGCCFICGRSQSEAEFNEEHILPDWILRKYRLHSRRITLPNLTHFRYDQYKVPCCEDCNSEMGRKIERPVRELLARGYTAVADYVQSEGPWLLFTWMALIFLKTHLRDRSLRFHRDQRETDHAIGDFYSWHELHHIHCVARSFYSKPRLDPKVMGSFVTLPAAAADNDESFDFGDLYDGRAVLIRLDDICFISVLNDSCASLNLFNDTLNIITGPLSPLQLREILARMAFINIKLKERPSFYTEVGRSGLTMSAHLPSRFEMERVESSEFGSVFYSCSREILDHLANPDSEEIRTHVREGRYTFLKDADGRFIANVIESGS